MILEREKQKLAETFAFAPGDYVSMQRSISFPDSAIRHCTGYLAFNDADEDLPYADLNIGNQAFIAAGLALVFSAHS